MYIDKLSVAPSFGLKLDKKLYKGAQKFYQLRDLPIQRDIFEKKVKKMEYWGDTNSELAHTVLEDNGCRTHLLCFRNSNMNNQQGIIIKKANQYNEILRFINNLDDDTIRAYEDYLIEM